MDRNKYSKVVAVALLFMAVCQAVLDYYLPAMGDDLRFWYQLGLEDYTMPNRSMLSFIAGHIVGCNGRILDYMGPVVINLLPRALAAAVMGAGVGTFFYAMLLSVGRGRGLHTAFSLVFLATALAVMPWWDYMWLRVCQFNYIWSTTVALLFVYFYFRQPGGPTFLLFILGVCAGGFHEQTGVAMCCAMFVWLMVSKPARTQKVMLAGLLLGTLLSLASPALWARAEATEHGDILHLVATTLPVYICMIATVLCIGAYRRGRAFLRRVSDGPAIVLLVAATVAAIIAVWSGIVGRTGWFAESAALVLLGRLVANADIHPRKMVAAVAGCIAAAFIAVHYVVAIDSQRLAYKEYTAVQQAYVAAPDGVVYYDFTDRYDFPAVALNRIKGVPDADDWWYRRVLCEAYKQGETPLVVVPTAFRGRLPLAVDSLSVGEATIYKSLPQGVRPRGSDGVLLQEWQGGIRVVERLPEGWLATPLVLDPGDYL